MTSAELPFGMWCWPGADAAAGVQQSANGDVVLTVFIDPVNLVISVPPFRTGPAVMARFCRELARAASRMAADLDPAGEVTRTPRHVRAEDGQPGAGGEIW